MIELNVQGIEAIRATFTRLVPEAQTKVLKGLAQVAFDTAQRQVDTHTQTGALFDSVRQHKTEDGSWIIENDLQRAPYAPFVHWGWRRTRPIYPKQKKALRWPSGQGGKTGFVFAKWVKTPAEYAGDPWLIQAADEAIRQFDAIVRRVEI